MATEKGRDGGGRVGGVGLCGSCSYGRRVQGRRGAIFWRCQRSVTDAAYPKYPPLPMLQCRGFEPSSPEDLTSQ